MDTNETQIRMHELLGMIGDLHRRVAELEKAVETKPKSRFQKPTPEMVDAYSKEIGANVNGQTFCDFYDSKGWKVGNTPMKDWKATVRTWKQKQGVIGNVQHVGFWPDKSQPKRADGFQPLFPGHRPDK